MNVFAGEMGFIEGPHYREAHYSSNLPSLDTANLFNHIPAEGPWRVPDPMSPEDKMFKISYTRKCDGLLLEWIDYLEQVWDGFQISHRAATENIVSGDLRSLEASQYFHETAFSQMKYQDSSEKVYPIFRAFLALLSKDAQKKLGLKGDEIHVFADDIQNARTLVSRFKDNISYIPDLSPEEEED